jgi:primosomal protein N' (replication factor Y)
MRIMVDETKPIEGPMFAQVAVDQPIDGELTYLIPPGLRDEVVVGARVMVPLGRGNRPSPATVVGLAEKGPDLPEVAAPVEARGDGELFADAAPVQARPQFKEILRVERDILPIPGDLIELGRWIAAYYCAPIGLTLSTMVPAAVKRATRIPAEMLVSGGAKKSDDAGKDGAELSARAKKSLAKILEFLGGGSRSERDVLESLEISRPTLRKLADGGFLKMERHLRNPAAAETAARALSAGHELSKDQQAAFEKLEPLLAGVGNPKFAVRLVFGVTGSGKTELYIRAIEKVVAAGKRAIVLVPEISLTPQTVRRFTQRFSRVAVLHSGLKDSERHQHWHAIASGWAQVIVGARSAIFAPASDVGLIVVDEEHDPSYKQDATPRYHGRDVAIRRAQTLGIPILLGSATPALESWHNAQVNPHYGLLKLTSRPLGMQMPRVVVVDMKGQSKERRGLHILSTHLEHHLKQTLEKKKQAIFLLNRRGYAHYVMCARCDWVLMCENCTATMVVHRTKEGGEKSDELGRGGFNERYGKVQCHYCQTAMMLPRACPVCQAKLTHLGQGTQRAEDELARKFPGLRMARMDSDSMHSQTEYQKTLNAFGEGELDLLIGTQMIAKGLDFPNVSLVGVLNADLAMTVPDFRAAERTFQLICQVAGRAGRPGASAGGTVIVQTFQPTEPAIVHACEHDYLGFVKSEMPHRQQFGYPPFGRMVRIVLSHKGYTKVHAEAEGMMKQIHAICERQNLPVRWHGPMPPPMERLVEMYRVEIILFADTAGPLQRLIAALRAREAFTQAGAAVTVDVDPVSMM